MLSKKKEEAFKTLRVRIPILQWKKVEGRIKYGEISKLFRKAFREFVERMEGGEKDE